MKFFVKNITNWPTDPGDVTQTCKHILVDGHRGYSGVVLKPQETMIVSDTGKDQLLKYYSDFIQVVGQAPDDSAPYQWSGTTPNTWTLVDLGAYFTNFYFIPSTTGVSVSFSGWDATNLLQQGAQTTPPAASIISVQPSSSAGQMFTLGSEVNPSRYIYVKGTAGTETMTIIAY